MAQERLAEVVRRESAEPRVIRARPEPRVERVQLDQREFEERRETPVRPVRPA